MVWGKLGETAEYPERVPMNSKDNIDMGGDPEQEIVNGHRNVEAALQKVVIYSEVLKPSKQEFYLYSIMMSD